MTRSYRYGDCQPPYSYCANLNGNIYAGRPTSTHWSWNTHMPNCTHPVHRPNKCTNPTVRIIIIMVFAQTELNSSATRCYPVKNNTILDSLSLVVFPITWESNSKHFKNQPSKFYLNPPLMGMKFPRIHAPSLSMCHFCLGSRLHLGKFRSNSIICSKITATTNTYMDFHIILLSYGPMLEINHVQNSQLNKESLSNKYC